MAKKGAPIGNKNAAGSRGGASKAKSPFKPVTVYTSSWGGFGTPKKSHTISAMGVTKQRDVIAKIRKDGKTSYQLVPKGSKTHGDYMKMAKQYASYGKTIKYKKKK